MIKYCWSWLCAGSHTHKKHPILTISTLSKLILNILYKSYAWKLLQLIARLIRFLTLTWVILNQTVITHEFELTNYLQIICSSSL